MNSIESLKLDFNSQIKQLHNIRNTKLFDDCIYVGSGDSYVAGLIVEYLTSHKCRCYSPSDLFNSKFIEDKTYCFISVTGKTKSNIEVAQRATQAGVKTVAVTSNENSKLAQICNEMVPVKITRMQTPNAGFGTFVANVLTCLQIAGLSVPLKFDIWYKNGIELSQKILYSRTTPEDTAFILGNNTLYPLALYASLQMAEFFGTTAIVHKLEEFCHSPIFGLKKTHNVWILGQKEEQISEKIAKLEGRQISYFELYNQDIVSQIFESIFFVQNLILLMAKKHGYTELRYVMMKDVLNVSSDIIYSDEAIL
jgi:glutamine---fructose-6-phosphate transaminase (isomerizing)